MTTLAQGSQSASSSKRGDSGKRRQGREMALQMLFQWEASSTHAAEVLRSFDLSLYQSETAVAASKSEPKPPQQHVSKSGEVGELDEGEEPDDIERRREAARLQNVERQLDVELGSKARSKAYQFAKSLLLGVVEHHEAFDQAIAAKADNWRIERMPRVDRNILRMAMLEAEELKELPKAVVIDEAIELAKRFGGENSGAFVNGLLDNLLTGTARSK